MGFKESVKTSFSKAFTFSGRARRAEYWYWSLFSVLVSLPLQILLEVIPEDSWVLMLVVGLVALGWGLFYAIATFAVSVRRLHDIGRSGWWYLLCLIPIANLVLIYFFICDSQPGANQYGENPKGM